MNPRFRLADVAAHWENEGETDAMWGVLTDPMRAPNGWSTEEFFRTGQEDVAAIYKIAADLGLDLATGGGAIDFGCGVGRLTQALADRHKVVTGIDVAQSMADRASSLAEVRGVNNVTFLVNTSSSLPFPDGSFDVSFTMIVLQHLPPAIARGYIRELIRVVRIGGTVMFQIPSHVAFDDSSAATQQRFLRILPTPASDLIRSMRVNRSRVRNHPMHGMRPAAVIRLVESCGARVVAAVEDGYAGTTWRSYKYFVVKSSVFD